MSLEMDQKSSGIEFVYVCVCEGGEGRLGCGRILLYSILYVTSILLVPSLFTTFNLLLLRVLGIPTISFQSKLYSQKEGSSEKRETPGEGTWTHYQRLRKRL